MSNSAKHGQTGINTPEPHPKYDKIDQAIVNLAVADPTLTNNAIANKLINIGLTNTHTTVYNRLTKKDYLRGEIDEIRANHREQISRELMPLALTVTRKALKSKDISEKDKHPYVAMVVKSDLGDQGADTKPATINIEHLERMQVIMRGNNR